MPEENQRDGLKGICYGLVVLPLVALGLFGIGLAGYAIYQDLQKDSRERPKTELRNNFRSTSSTEITNRLSDVKGLTKFVQTSN